MSRPFDWLYEALPGYNSAMVTSAIAEYQAEYEEGPPYRSAEQWIRGVREILSTPAEYTPEQITEHWLRQRHHKAVTVARQWEDNAERWRMYAEHLEDCVQAWAEEAVGRQHVIDALLEYIAELPLPSEGGT